MKVPCIVKCRNWNIIMQNLMPCQKKKNVAWHDDVASTFFLSTQYYHEWRCKARD
jgi:hypothetical protein